MSKQALEFVPWNPSSLGLSDFLFCGPKAFPKKDFLNEDHLFPVFPDSKRAWIKQVNDLAPLLNDDMLRG